MGNGPTYSTILGHLLRLLATLRDSAAHLARREAPQGPAVEIFPSVQQAAREHAAFKPSPWQVARPFQKLIAERHRPSFGPGRSLRQPRGNRSENLAELALHPAHPSAASALNQ